MNARKTLRYLPLGIVIASVLCSVGVRLFGRSDLRVPVGLPALLLTGWSFAGHLITLDEDAPGGWSNSGDSHQVWHRSLLQLAVLLAIFGITCWIVVFWGNDPAPMTD